MAKNYVNNKVLLHELKLSFDSSMGPEPTDELIKMWQLMATKFSYNMQYRDPMDRDDIIQQGVIDCYAYWKNFDVNKGSNAFAYFTQIIKNGAAKAWRVIHPIHFRGSISISRWDIWSI